jgi:hypothetical protein
MAYQEEDSQEVSKYNEAALQIMRLHELWLKAEHYANSGQLIKWKFTLDSIWRELCSDINLRMTNSKKIMEKNIEIREKIADAKERFTLYNALDRRHQFLKNIQDEVGKGGIYGEADDEDFD